MKLKHLFLFLVSCVSLDTFGQDDVGAWYIYNGSYLLSPKNEIFFETQARLREPLSNKEEIFFRPIFIRHFNSKWNGGLGYTYHLNFSDASTGDNTKFSHENRIILQAQIYTPINRTNIQHRLRLEQRWITYVSDSETEVRQRFRYRLQATVPLGNEKLEAGTFFLNFYNELFINLHELSFDQNRLYGAAGYQFTPSTNLQIGYLFQYKNEQAFHRLQFFITQKLYFFDR